MDIRGTAFLTREVPEAWTVIESAWLDTPGAVAPPPNPYAAEPACAAQPGEQPILVHRVRDRSHSYNFV